MLEYDRIDISESIDINKCEETSNVHFCPLESIFM